MILTTECAVPDCRSTAQLEFNRFLGVQTELKNALGIDDENAARAMFDAPLPLCYAHYRQAVNIDRRSLQELNKQERTK